MLKKLKNFLYWRAFTKLSRRVFKKYKIIHFGNKYSISKEVAKGYRYSVLYNLKKEFDSIKECEAIIRLCKLDAIKDIRSTTKDILRYKNGKTIKEI